MKAFLVFFLFISSTFAHNWLMTPYPYSTNTATTPPTIAAQTNAPCDSGTYNTPTHVRQDSKKGGSFGATWSTNHAGDHTLYLVPSGDQATLETQTDTSHSEAIYYGDFPVSTGATTVTFGVAAPGAYVLQYRWSNYRNCAPLFIEYPTSDKAVAAGAPGKYTVPGGTFDANTGMITCDKGYHPTKGNTECSKAMSPAGAFFLALFVILVFLFLVFVVLFGLRKTGHLNNKLGDVVETSTSKITCGKVSASPSTSAPAQKA